jgi:phage portal protein BeeE
MSLIDTFARVFSARAPFPVPGGPPARNIPVPGGRLDEGESQGEFKEHRNSPALGGRLPGGESPSANKKSESEAPIIKASATGPLISYQTLGKPVWAPRDYSAFAREGFMQNAIVYRCVRMIAEAAASIPLLLYEGTTEIEDHPLIGLLRRPSLDHTGTDFLEAWYGFLLVSGNAYAEAVALDGELRELHILRPDRMKVIPGLDGWPEGYEYTACGRSVRFIGDVVEDVRPILHVRLFHPVNDHYGMSPIEAAATAIDIHNTASSWNKALLDN